MSTYPPSFDRMMAARNETDPESIRAHLDLALGADVTFVDPTIVTRGFDSHHRHYRLARRFWRASTSSNSTPTTRCTGSKDSPGPPRA
jgi:hypothetical protein